MVEYQKKQSSGVSKAALATAIGAGAVALSNGNNLGGGLLSGLFGSAPQAAPVGAAPAADFVLAGCGGLVTNKDMGLIQEVAAKDSTIAKLEAKIYTDEKVAVSLAPVYAELSKQKDDICDLKSALAMETERRSCGDEKLLTYVNGNFIKAEKSLNSKHINYHGIKPVLQVDECCDCNCD